jgi:hypothetical protein
MEMDEEEGFDEEGKWRGDETKRNGDNEARLGAVWVDFRVREEFRRVQTTWPIPFQLGGIKCLLIQQTFLPRENPSQSQTATTGDVTFPIATRQLRQQK